MMRTPYLALGLVAVTALAGGWTRAAPVETDAGDAVLAATSAMNGEARVLQATDSTAGGTMSDASHPLDATPEALAQRQLAAYNARDIEAFLAPYSEDVEVYDYPGRLLYTGKARMRERYAGLFAASPALHCDLVARMVLGNVVIDHEHLSGHRDGVSKAIAIYTVRDGRIARVEFVK